MTKASTFSCARGVTRVFALMLIAVMTLGVAMAYAEVKAVESVDLPRYLGRWYEIASIPQFFQRKCVRDTNAEYSQLESGELRVENTCQREDGGREKAEGRARRSDPNATSKLEVTFLKLFGDYRFWAGGDYWVIELDPAYEWAVVGHPSRKYGWVLARKQSLSVPVIAEIVGRIKAQGYDACEFFVSPQTGGMTIRRPLCDALP
jgi:apolipoprotein D and lipocalin family protein